MTPQWFDAPARRAAVSTRGVTAFQPFVPAPDFDTSLAFYADLGFQADLVGYGLAEISLDPVRFILQRRPDDGLEIGDKLWLQLVVDDLDAWWSHIAKMDLRDRYGASAARVNALASWGLAPVYLWDPAGVTWALREG